MPAWDPVEPQVEQSPGAPQGTGDGATAPNGSVEDGLDGCADGSAGMQGNANEAEGAREAGAEAGAGPLEPAEEAE
eukprot:15474702-Alexandrium_andersonii.AAC.1